MTVPDAVDGGEGSVLGEHLSPRAGRCVGTIACWRERKESDSYCHRDQP
jgi:hypothetical protein